jgi:hypothetical protein
MVYAKNAMWLHNLGYAPIPAKRGEKETIVGWTEYQQQQPPKEKIEEWSRKHRNANIALLMGNAYHICLLDQDGPEGKKILEELLPPDLVTPTADTPRKDGGVHRYFYCDEPMENKTKFLPGLDFKCNGGYGIVAPSRTKDGEYRWREGQSIFEVKPAPLPEKLKEILRNGAGEANAHTRVYKNAVSYKRVCRQFVDSAAELFIDGHRDEDLFHVVNALVKGGLDNQEILQVADILAKNCHPPFDEKELTVFLDSALKRAAKRERSLSQEVRDWVCLQNGYIMSTDIYSCLQLSTREDKKNVHIILKRMCDEGLVERYGNRSGCFRVIDTVMEEIDFKNVQSEFLDIKFPFGEERYVQLLPKNIAVIAGTPDAGKTAYLLNFAKLNMNKFDVYYFSSEMGAQELRGRMEKFDYPIDKWKLKAFERCASFSDVIKPDAINIIDFLEISKDFYLVAELIKNIFNKLRKGIAILAMQKDFGAPYGRGKSFGMEKARLYISIERHLLKMVKAKNWVNSAINPNGMELEFKIRNGCEFYTVRDWHKPEREA